MTKHTHKKILIILSICFILLTLVIIYKHYRPFEQDIATSQNHETKHKNDNHSKHLKTIVDQSDPKMEEINNYLKQVEFNGTAAVYVNGKLKLNKGYGIQNFEENKENRADTLYLIGSAQKFMTGLMLKQLVNENKINMDDPVDKYLPWFKTKKPITLNQLMLHKSGLYKYKASPSYKNLTEAVHAIQHKGIENKFYNKNRYNDANYLVLSSVIEAVTHQSYVENFKKRIAQPQHLDFTAFFDNENLQSYMANGYKKDNVLGNPVKQIPNVLEQYYGAGNLYMSPSDMGKLILSLQQNKIFSSQITNPLIHESLTSQYPQPYRYGFYSFGDKNRINGGFFGQVFTSYFKENKTYILSNTKAGRFI
ncbi:serine hydrolase domain-containing protein [Staphylococcus caeli]|uniref:Autolysis and methicillin resistant-related protein n=1 Tax=Staphylococcus caeli TaxID=2201815 RepID=A0A1D4M103_9STAP|nr:serine hydrolase domain-containing protein [Staphylococcus caeli]SCS51126.1 autolysis and methicillin resistant-related protein [Staphylococcus caeli]SCS92109.1 autolysis and methicillin resistant-related protein [Staphylococcus caeli]